MIKIDISLSTDSDDFVNIEYHWETLSEPSVEEKQCANRLITAVRDEIRKIGLDTLLGGGEATSLKEEGVDDRRIGF